MTNLKKKHSNGILGIGYAQLLAKLDGYTVSTSSSKPGLCSIWCSADQSGSGPPVKTPETQVELSFLNYKLTIVITSGSLQSAEVGPSV